MEAEEVIKCNDVFPNLVFGVEKQERETQLTLQKFLSRFKEFSLDAQRIVRDNEERQKLTKERFNVFEALTKHHSEELHSRFLLYLLDPTEKHDCGALFLRLFLQTVISDTDNGLLEKVLADADKAIVYREMHIGFSANTDDYGRIDLFIQLSCLNIAVENKIYAGEQANQLKRYAGYCKDIGKQYKILYLTLHGSDSHQAYGEEYDTISYEDHIVNWLDNCIEATRQYPTVYVGINYYRELVLRRLLNKTPNQTIMDLKKVLLNENNSILINYASEIAEALNEIEFELRKGFFEKLVKELSKRYTVECLAGMKTTIYAGQIWDDRARGLIIVDESYSFSIDSDEQLYFCLEHNYDNIYFGLFGLRNGEGKNAYSTIDIESRPLAKVIQQRMTQISTMDLELPDDGWLAWSFFHLEQDTQFNSSRLNQSLQTDLDKHVRNLVNQIDEYLVVWKQVLETIKTSE